MQLCGIARLPIVLDLLLVLMDLLLVADELAPILADLRLVLPDLLLVVANLALILPDLSGVAQGVRRAGVLSLPLLPLFGRGVVPPLRRLLHPLTGLRVVGEELSRARMVGQKLRGVRMIRKFFGKVRVFLEELFNAGMLGHLVCLGRCQGSVQVDLFHVIRAADGGVLFVRHHQTRMRHPDADHQQTAEDYSLRAPHHRSPPL